MTRKTFWLAAIAMALALSTAARETEPADVVLERLEGNLAFKTAFFSGETTITNKSRVSVKAFFAYLEGKDNFFLEYVSPARDRGQRLLRKGDKLLLYLPSAGKVLKVGKSRQRRLGSTFSLDDVADLGGDLRSRFSAGLVGEETIDGRPCDLLRLAALQPGQTYAARLLWVDRETAVVLRCQYFSRSNKLVRELSAGDIRKSGRRYFAGRLLMTDRLRRGTSTEIVIRDMAFDAPLPPGIFDEKNLAPPGEKN